MEKSLQLILIDMKCEMLSHMDHQLYYRVMQQLFGRISFLRVKNMITQI